jgi:hypothetical protein
MIVPSTTNCIEPVGVGEHDPRKVHPPLSGITVPVNVTVSPIVDMLLGEEEESIRVTHLAPGFNVSLEEAASISCAKTKQERETRAKI